MSTIAVDLPTNYATEENTISSWLLTRDHKRIALLFFGSITFFFFIGGLRRNVDAAESGDSRRACCSPLSTIACSRCTAS